MSTLTIEDMIATFARMPVVIRLVMNKETIGEVRLLDKLPGPSGVPISESSFVKNGQCVAMMSDGSIRIIKIKEFIKES